MLRNNPVEFNSCFISYSTKDQKFAERLHADLQAKGVRCWFAPHDTKGGRKLYEQIDAAIHIHNRVLLILSRDSINSEWVKREIEKALKRQGQEKRDILFPIRLVEYEQLESWSTSTPLRERTSLTRSAPTSFLTSATGKTTTPIKQPSTAC